MPARDSYDYAVVRVVPRVDREEFINAGVILFCKARRYLSACVQVDDERLRALAADVDLELVRRHLEAIPRICAGEADAGPLARLSQSERFHWLVSPHSTMIQSSPVHGGICEDPEGRLDALFRQLVAR
ncbi:MAG TPA: DUF3037 domain-containing protein [Bryobacteraceae bacterium]|jgi:hypothetical protein|nr:DUF3037 domain-containing protein [Bryobacteraceae bacterium]